MALRFSIRDMVAGDRTTFVSLWNAQRTETNSRWEDRELLSETVVSGLFSSNDRVRIAIDSAVQRDPLGFIWVSAILLSNPVLAVVATSSVLSGAERRVLFDEMMLDAARWLVARGGEFLWLELNDRHSAETAAINRFPEAVTRFAIGFTPTTLADPVTRNPVEYEYRLNAAEMKRLLEADLGVRP